MEKGECTSRWDETCSEWPAPNLVLVCVSVCLCHSLCSVRVCVCVIRWGKSHLPLESADEELLEGFPSLVTVTDILESLRCILTTNV